LHREAIGVVEKSRKSTAEAANERREAKLAAVREQVEKGTLVIRQMTDAERERHPPRPKPTNGRER
jgi:hypothetical protein